MKIKPIYERTSEYIRASWREAVKRRDVDKNFVMPCDYVPPCVDGDLTNLYYWDTYFTNLGLLGDGEGELARGNIENLIFCLYKFGCVPNMCRANGATYASQPPLLFMMAKDYYECSGDKEFLKSATSRSGSNTVSGKKNVLRRRGSIVTARTSIIRRPNPI